MNRRRPAPIAVASLLGWRARNFGMGHRDPLQWAVFEFGGPWPNETPLAKIEAAIIEREKKSESLVGGE